jgi:hypothetical protein
VTLYRKPERPFVLVSKFVIGDQPVQKLGDVRVALLAVPQNNAAFMPEIVPEENAVREVAIYGASPNQKIPLLASLLPARLL